MSQDVQAPSYYYNQVINSAYLHLGWSGDYPTNASRDASARWKIHRASYQPVLANNRIDGFLKLIPTVS